MQAWAEMEDSLGLYDRGNELRNFSLQERQEVVRPANFTTMPAQSKSPLAQISNLVSAERAASAWGLQGKVGMDVACVGMCCANVGALLLGGSGGAETPVRLARALSMCASGAFFLGCRNAGKAAGWGQAQWPAAQFAALCRTPCWPCHQAASALQRAALAQLPHPGSPCCPPADHQVVPHW